MRMLGLIVAGGLIAGCNFVDTAAQKREQPTARAAVKPPADALPMPAEERGTPAKAEGETGFIYEPPKGVAERFPELGRWLAADEAEAKTAYDKMVAEYPKDGGGPAADMLTLMHQWEVASENERLLVLKDKNYVYQGGAHGLGATTAYIWDKQIGKMIDFFDMFADPAAAKAQLTPAFCAMLDAERVGRRGEAKPAAPDPDDMFWQCPDAGEASAFPTELGPEGAYSRIGFSIPPYGAGPYAEGSYDFTIAAPTALTDLLKPEYKRAFDIYL